MTNLEWLENVKENNIDFDTIQEYDLKYRKMKALEIIAEELINLNTTLENIETMINNRVRS